MNSIKTRLIKQNLNGLTDVIGTDVWECTTVSLLLQKLLLITIIFLAVNYIFRSLQSEIELFLTGWIDINTVN